MWQEFVSNTTLHGIRYVFTKRHIVIRLTWMILLLTSAGYYILTVYEAVNKFYSRPINTVIGTTHVKEIDFPAVTICPLNFFAKKKLYMTDDNPLFASSGLNISACALTSRVRGNRPCGLSLLCCCRPPQSVNTTASLPNCTDQYRQALLGVLRRASHHVDFESFFRYYSQDINALIGPVCTFGLSSTCSPSDFLPLVTSWGMCMTFNSGNAGKVKIIESGGVTRGLSVLLDIQISDYTQGKFSEGVKVVIHGQGEYIDEWEGINIGPGQHAVLSLAQRKFTNLEKPYATNCVRKKLKTYSVYTMEGCLFECKSEKIIKRCSCRPIGCKVASSAPICSSEKELLCSFNAYASSDSKSCACNVPCSYTEYSADVSYSKFPDSGTADSLVKNGYYKDLQYQRDNLVFLQVGFKSLSYEIQEQQPAYDRNSLFGEIGGNMGLFLGCSLLTLWEFVDFLINMLTKRKRQSTHPA